MVLFIYGTRGAGVEVYDLVARNYKLKKKYSKIYFIDDFMEEKDFYGTKTLPFAFCRKYMEDEEAEFIIAVGEPSARRLLYEKVKSEGYSLATLVDEKAVVSDTAKIAEGCVINAYAVVSSEVIIKENCFLMFECIVGHHALVERHCVICPKATVGGYSRIGIQTFLGLGSSMMQRVNIGNEAIVGLGSMVFRDVEDGMTVLGNPARATKGNSKHKVFS